jgi:DNA-binding NtrC family response regulator
VAGAGATILVVDDEVEFGDLLAVSLQQEEYTVILAQNGLHALDQLARHHIDAMLVDLRMPELDGIGFYNEVQRRHPELRTRVGFMTGDILGELDQSFLASVHAPSLEKPFRLEAASEILRRLLRR